MESDYSNYCRLCLADNNLRVMEISTIDIIRSEFSIVVENDDELSKEICYSCKEFLPKYVSFKTKINKKQSILRGILRQKKKCVSDDTVSTCVSSTTKNPTSERSERKMVDSTTTVTSTTKNQSSARSEKKSLNASNNELMTSLMEQPKTNNNRLSTGKFSNVGTDSVINDNSKLTGEELITKIIKSINLDEIKKNTEDVTWPGNSQCCYVCNTKVLNFEEFQKHVRSNTHKFRNYVIRKSGNPAVFSDFRVGYTCRLCGEIFSSKVMMCAHSKELHKQVLSRNVIFPDTIIPKRKSDDVKCKLPIEENIKQEPGLANQKAYKCRFCDKAFGFVESLNRHHKKHHKDIFLCTRCSHSTKNRRNFIVHLREHLHLKFKEKICSQCFKICASQLELSKHRKDSHANVLYICALCHQKFSNSTQLKKHKRDHRAENERKNNTYMCKRCNRSFLSSLVLTKHQCVALKYPCLKNCRKRFDTYSEMQRHSIKCTTGSTIYKCQFCKKSLKTLTSLQRHMLRCSNQSASARTSNETDTAKKIERYSEICSNVAYSQTQSPVVTAKQESKHSLVRTKHSKRLNSRSRAIKKQKKNTSEQKKKKQVIKIASKVEEHSKISNTDCKYDLACQVCGIVLKSEEFLKNHLFSFHHLKTETLPSRPLPARNPSAKPVSKTSSKDKNKNPDLSNLNIPTVPSIDLTCHKSIPPTKIETLDKHVYSRDYSNSPRHSSVLRNSPVPSRKIEIENSSRNYRENERPSSRTEPSRNYHQNYRSSSRPRPSSRPNPSRSHQNYRPSSRPEPSRNQQNYRPSSRAEPPRNYHENNRPSSRAEPSYNRSNSNKFSSGINQKSSGTSTKLLQPDYLVEAGKSNVQLTIIPNSRKTCYICRSTAPHLFCSPCARCFRQNQVQYMNHVKMKHSS